MTLMFVRGSFTFDFGEDYFFCWEILRKLWIIQDINFNLTADLNTFFWSLQEICAYATALRHQASFRHGDHILHGKLHGSQKASKQRDIEI